MNLKRIRAFTLVVEKGSFSEAADSMGLTQPAVSQQIKTLEEELGSPLLDRSAPGVGLTPAGRLAYEKGKQLLAIWEELAETTRAMQGKLAGTLHIGASTIPGTYLIPRWMSLFVKQHPLVEIKLQIGDSREMLHKMINRQVDLCFIGCSLNQEDTRLVVDAIADDTLVLIASKQWEVPSVITIEWLKRQPFLLREEGSGTREVMERSLRGQGVPLHQLRVIAELGNTEAVIAAVESGMGLSFVSGLAAQPAAAAGRIQILNFEPVFQRCFCIAYLQSRRKHPLISAFHQAVRTFQEATCSAPESDP
ncbi:MAG: hypothetical protein BAA01_14895 [Bacillus thermozeamaize]|uniref:HTH lysR-type domain-containing protein n=1 Tax=Bacillus thermozeamaize TaxID=230954 RepID=A0A1Y3PD96_9BACI|nr:MAG: hypothetical protein BAA01_14895 [Bacillus thermozeamaize]